MSPEQEKQEYIATLKNFNDRQLAELQTYYARKTMDVTKSMNSKLYFFYVLGIISVIVFLIYCYNISIFVK